MPSPQEQEDIIRFGKKVREIRLAKNLTMEELANIAEIELSQIFRIETAKRTARLSTVFTIARALNVSPKEFFED